jgi:hypothetical protein
LLSVSIETSRVGQRLHFPRRPRVRYLSGPFGTTLKFNEYACAEEGALQALESTGTRLELRRATEPTCEVPARRRVQERGAHMKRKVYEHVLGVNQGFDQVLRSLKALAKYHGLQPNEIRRFEQLARETRAATNSFVLESLGRLETADAGRLFVQRKAREQREEQP